ncbi:MAG: peptide deformylase [Rhodobacter sp.]|nr:peptide deformylase [Rhodobacter sp.]
MSVLPILVYGDARLRQVAQPVVVDDKVRALAADMIETMYDAPGRGLAAPQVGVSLRMFVMDCHWKDGAGRDPLVVVNPVLSDPSEDVKPFTEGCLSIPGVLVEVTRPAQVTLRWENLDGEVFARRLCDFEAVCAQHEYDHLDGVLNTDYLSDAARAEVADRLAELAA